MSSTAPDKPSMYCRQCQYILDGLPENRCPECNTPFDPKHSSTFDAPVNKDNRLCFTPTMLAVFGIGFYISVFMILPSDADVKSDGWMRVWLTFLAVGPPYAFLVLLSAFLKAKREHRARAVVPPVVATILLMAIWFILYQGYIYTKRDIEAVRAHYMRQMQQQSNRQQ